jgi:hypothetical protein
MLVLVKSVADVVLSLAIHHGLSQEMVKLDGTIKGLF